MSQQAFDVFTRRAAAGVTRRSSLATLGAAGLAALASSSLTAEAKDKSKKFKKKFKQANQALAQANQALDQANQKCPAQVGQCQTFFDESSVPQPSLRAYLLTCCDFLAECNYTGYIVCVRGAA